MTQPLDESLNAEQRRLMDSLDTPAKIQAFLDSVSYSAEEANRCVPRVLADRQAHCLDGGLFAAAALRRLGYPPMIVDLLPDPGMDDDHVLAIYRRNGGLGSLAKSNFVGLRSREPVYRSLRELIMSYFNDCYNVDGVKTLRYYTRPLKLATYDHLNWMGSDAGQDAIETRLKELHKIPLITADMAACLSPVDRLTYDAGMMVVNRAGLYKPRR